MSIPTTNESRLHMERQCRVALEEAGLDLVPTLQWEASTRKMVISFAEIRWSINCTIKIGAA